MLAEFLKRLDALDANAKAERALVTAAFGIAENLKTKADACRLDPKLTPIGIADEIKKIAMGSPLDHLKQIRGQVDGMKKDVANLRSSFVPKPSDLTFEELKEIRGWLVVQPERFRLAFEIPVIAAAVLQAAIPQLTGLSPEQIGLIREKQVEIAHGPQIKGLERREAMIEEIDAAVKTATVQFCRESGIDRQEI